ncbi:hypothetical protein D3C85_1917490 [compost metagenome]
MDTYRAVRRSNEVLNALKKRSLNWLILDLASSSFCLGALSNNAHRAGLNVNAFSAEIRIAVASV